MLRSCLLSCLLVLALAAPAQSRRVNVDISCEAVGNLKSETATALALWLPGWWAAEHDDPYINAARVSIVVDTMANYCFTYPQKRLLDSLDKLHSMPPVLDHALNTQCKQFSDSSEQWQIMFVYWLEGYMANQADKTVLDDNMTGVLQKYQRICFDAPGIRMEEAARRAQRSGK